MPLSLLKRYNKSAFDRFGAWNLIPINVGIRFCGKFTDTLVYIFCKVYQAKSVMTTVISMLR